MRPAAAASMHCAISGTLQVDGYATYKQLTDPKRDGGSPHLARLLVALPPPVLRHRQGRQAGIWDRMMDAIVQAQDGKVQMIGSSIVRVH
jgi:hypothetical protein